MSSSGWSLASPGVHFYWECYLTSRAAHVLCNACFTPGRNKKTIFRRNEIQTCSVLQFIVSFCFCCDWGLAPSVEMLEAFLTEHTHGPTHTHTHSHTHTHIHTYTHTHQRIVSLSWGCWRFGWGQEMVVVVFPQTLLGVGGDACPRNHQPREPLAKKYIMCPAGSCVYVRACTQ